MDKKKAKSGILDNKILWAIVSLLASVLLWVLVTISVGDMKIHTFESVPVVFKGEDTLFERYGLVLSNISTTTVNIRVKAPLREIAKLESSVITAEVDVSRFTTKGSHSQIVTPRFPPGTNTSSIDFATTSPTSITFNVDKTVTKTVEVDGKFVGTVAEGYAQQPMRFDPQSITVTGPGEIVSKIAHAWVEVGRIDVDKTIQAEYPYQLIDEKGNEVPTNGLVFSRETVTVTVPINSTKEVPLTIDRIDGAGATDENVEITLDPATITIAGDAETLEGINKISLGTIDLSSFASSYENKHQIILDNTVTNVTGIKEVKVTIKVIGLETKKFNVSNITTINAPAGRTVSIVTENLEITLRGKNSVLSKIAANNIRVVADLSDIGTASGVFEPIAKVHIDGFTGVGAIGSYSVYVKIK